jgi:hypothetical protein
MLELDEGAKAERLVRRFVGREIEPHDGAGSRPVPRNGAVSGVPAFHPGARAGHSVPRPALCQSRSRRNEERDGGDDGEGQPEESAVSA